jgi:uncharacterized DUF497 family protein
MVDIKMVSFQTTNLIQMNSFHDYVDYNSHTKGTLYDICIVSIDIHIENIDEKIVSIVSILKSQ